MAYQGEERDWRRNLIVWTSPTGLFSRVVLWWYGSERLPPNFDAHLTLLVPPPTFLLFEPLESDATDTMDRKI